MTQEQKLEIALKSLQEIVRLADDGNYLIQNYYDTAMIALKEIGAA